MTGRPIAVSFFADHAARALRCETLTLDQLADRIAQASAPAKTDLPWLKLGIFGDVRSAHGSLRHDRNLLRISGIEIDYDGEEIAFENAVEQLEKEGIEALVYTSPSHLSDGHGPRWRILCPLSQDWDPEDRSRFVDRLAGLFRRPGANGADVTALASESWTRSQAFFFGSINGNPAHRVQVVEGKYLDELHELDLIALEKPVKLGPVPNGRDAGPHVAGRPEAGIADIRAALEAIANDWIDWEEWNRLALAVFAASGGSQEGFDAFAAWSRQCKHYDADETKRMWDHLHTSPPTHIGFGSLLYWARQAAADFVLPSEQAREEERARGLADLDARNPPSDGTPVDPGTWRPRELPRPLMRQLPPADPFPIDALGDVLGATAHAIHDRVQAPLAIGAQSVLGAATLAVQGYADVVLPIGPGRAKPISDFFITIGISGERKTECDQQALWPIRAHERALRDAYDADVTEYRDDKAAWEKAREVALKAGKGDREKIRTALRAVGPMPAAPLEPMLTCDEPTIEGLHKLFGIGWPSLGLFAAEGGRFIGGHGMTDEAKLRTVSSLSTLWDGEPIKRVRATDATVTMPGRRLALHLMVQPDVADIWFCDRLLAGQGLLSRLLASAPDSAAGTRFQRDERPETDRDLKRYGARLLSILETPLPLAADKTNELVPRELPLSPEACRLWRGFADHVERAIAPNGTLETVRGLANKLPEHAARLAAVLTLVRDIDAGEIASGEMQAGIELAEHYACESLRLFGTSRISADLRLAQRLLDWLLNVWTEANVSLPDIYQRSLNAIGDKATASKLVGVLEEHGWLRKLPRGTVIAGQYRRDGWVIVSG